MLAHSFSVSKPPEKEKPTVSNAQLMRKTVEQATVFAFSNLGEWCLLGSFPVKNHSSKKQAYRKAYYYHEKIEISIAQALAYHMGSYPVEWSLDWNKSKKQYELRIRVSYAPEAEYANGVSPTVEKAQVNSLKNVLDSFVFGERQ
jgi:hypothetical protein